MPRGAGGKKERKEGQDEERETGAQRFCVLGWGPMVNRPELTIIITTLIIAIIAILLYMQATVTTGPGRGIGVRDRPFHIQHNKLYMIRWS